MRSHLSRRPLVLLSVAFLLSVPVPGVSEARVVRLVIEQRELFAGGVEWGASRAYERLRGTAYLEVDPSNPLNAVIVDLDKAPRNAQGMVEFSTPFFILKPVDMARGNHRIYYTVNNRGNNPGGLIAAQTAAQVGSSDVYLRMGYTIVDAGWEGDVVPTPTRLAANLPIATQPDGSPIVGLMRVEYSDRTIPLAGTFTFTLKGNAAFTSYETADTNTAHSTFTVRESVNAPKRPIPPDRWAFGRCPTGQASLVPTTFDIGYFDGFRNDRLYELIYPAKNPIVMGLGHATTRDVASFLRYETHDDARNPNPLGPSPGHVGITRAYATGASQTGGYLRDFIYLGFNEDETHRKVFDGIIPTIAGTDRVFINVRFADPDIYSEQDDRHDFLQSSYPPFTYAVTTDPISGIHDGVMKRPATDPLVFQIDSSSEFWQLRGSLNVVDGLGKPVPIPDNVRLYINSSTAHGNLTAGLRTPPPGQNALCEHPTPSGAIAETQRALLVAMDEWADQGIEPPKSNYPNGKGTLVSLDEARGAFPDIPGVDFPTVLNEYELLDFGPEFGSHGGVLTLQPPRLGPSYRLFVPKTDKDGLDIAGIRPIQIRVPLGTTTGWNIRAPGHRPPDLCRLTGSFFPFAETKGERLANGDPRKSLEERYKDHEGFVKAVRKAAKELVHERFLLQEDADSLISAAEASDVLR
jgi:Alpha/beta hydrolase domain